MLQRVGACLFVFSLGVLGVCNRPIAEGAAGAFASTLSENFSVFLWSPPGLVPTSLGKHPQTCYFIFIFRRILFYRFSSFSSFFIFLLDFHQTGTQILQFRCPIPGKSAKKQSNPEQQNNKTTQQTSNNSSRQTSSTEEAGSTNSNQTAEQQQQSTSRVLLSNKHSPWLGHSSRFTLSGTGKPQLTGARAGNAELSEKRRSLSRSISEGFCPPSSAVCCVVRTPTRIPVSFGKPNGCVFYC